MPTATATYAGHILASASDSEYALVEGNVYFPPTSLKDPSVFTVTKTQTTCPWKGKASYYELDIDGKKVNDVAWFYATPKAKAEHIKDFVAFCSDWTDKNKVDVTVN